MLIVLTALLWWLIGYLHVSTMWLAARAANITVRKVSYGIGPTIVKTGRVSWGIFPWSGSVQMKDCRAEKLDPKQNPDAYDAKHPLIRAFVPLTAPLPLLCISVTVLGQEGWTAFFTGFKQIVMMAIFPASTGQTLLESYASYAASASMLSIFCLLCAKHAALNLFPLPFLNGGDALLAASNIRNRSPRLEYLTIFAGSLLAFLLYAGLFVALGVFVWRYYF